MHAGIFIRLAGLVLLAGCSAQYPEINTICQRDAVGNYIIKWETSPEIKGRVELAVSLSPDMQKPTTVGYANIRDGVMKYVTNDPLSRNYFRLTFDNKYEQIVSSRSVPMDSIPNFRDIGGYLSSQGQKTRWGMIYRSGEISRMSEWDIQRLDKLKIRTIIDLRSENEASASPIRYTKAQVVAVPIALELDHMTHRIMEGMVRKGDVSLFMQDLYLHFATNTEAFEQALSLFMQEENYPILFLCTRGKDRTGFLSALLMMALDIPVKTIVSDYASTNDYIDLTRYSTLVGQLDTDVQEAMTVALSANEDYMNLVFRKIRKEYGSTGRYMNEKLHLTEKQKEKFKDIMLF